MSFSNEIITILDDLGKRFGIVADWSNENVLPYLTELCERFINWQITTSVVWIVISVIALAVCVFLIIRSVKRMPEATWSEEDFYMGCIVCSLIVGILSSICLLVQVFDICRCLCMPELEIYNYISNLIG